jgi:hypothetical protein
MPDWQCFLEKRRFEPVFASGPHADACRRARKHSILDSILDEIVEQSRLERLQRRLLIVEELGLGFAHLPALLRVAIEGVVGDFFRARLSRQAAARLVWQPEKRRASVDCVDCVTTKMRFSPLICDFCPSVEVFGTGARSRWSSRRAMGGAARRAALKRSSFLRCCRTTRGAVR